MCICKDDGCEHLTYAMHRLLHKFRLADLLIHHPAALRSYGATTVPLVTW